MDQTNPEETGAFDLQSAGDALVDLIGDEDELPEAEEEGNPVEDDPEVAEAEEESEESEEPEPEEEPEEPETLDSLEAIAAKAGIDLDQTVTFRAAGEDVTVTLGELRKGYQRDADYRRQTQELGQQRETLAQEFQQKELQVQQAGEMYGAMIGQVRAMVAGDLNSPEMQQLRQTNPAEWSARQNEFALKLQGLDQLQNNIAANLVQQRQAMAQQQLAHLEQFKEAENEKLLQAIPDWTNTTGSQIRDYLGGYGFGGGELDQIYDHRQLVIARKAMLYDQLQQVEKKTKQKVTQLPQAQKPGKKTSQSGKQRRLNQAKAQHKKSQSLESAALLIGENL